MTLELQLRAVQAGRDADELREVQDRHLEVLARLLAQLRLPGVQREVAERARRDHRVGAGLLRLLDRLDELGERDVLTCLDDREAAALDLRRVVDRLAAARGDDPLERLGLVGILEAEELRRAQDLAAVERRDLEPLQALVRRALQQLVALAGGDEPEEVQDVDAARVRRRADGDEVLVHAGEQRLVVLQRVVGLPEVERADVADRHQRVRARLLGVGEDARVQVEVVVGLRLVDVAGAAARHGLELDELETHLRRERLRRRVELLRRERGEAALVVRDRPHDADSSGESGAGNEPSPYGSRGSPSACSSRRESAFSAWTMPSAPCRSCCPTRS